MDDDDGDGSEGIDSDDDIRDGNVLMVDQLWLWVIDKGMSFDCSWIYQSWPNSHLQKLLLPSSLRYNLFPLIFTLRHVLSWLIQQTPYRKPSLPFMNPD